jgi:hypothetical protein
VIPRKEYHSDFGLVKILKKSLAVNHLTFIIALMSSPTIPRNWVLCRQALLAKRLTFADLGRITGYTRESVYNIVGGHNRSALARKKIERALDLEAGSLRPTSVKRHKTKPKKEPT